MSTDYFYRMAEPIRVLARDLTKPVYKNGKAQDTEKALPGLPYNLSREELIAYAYDQFGVTLSKKKGISTLVAEIYEMGSDLEEDLGE